jgi:hypothetical protein
LLGSLRVLRISLNLGSFFSRIAGNRLLFLGLLCGPAECGASNGCDYWNRHVQSCDKSLPVASPIALRGSPMLPPPGQPRPRGRKRLKQADQYKANGQPHDPVCYSAAVLRRPIECHRQHAYVRSKFRAHRIILLKRHNTRPGGKEGPPESQTSSLSRRPSGPKPFTVRFWSARTGQKGINAATAVQTGATIKLSYFLRFCWRSGPESNR